MSKVKFFHMRSAVGQAGCTIAYTVNPETKEISYYVSRCNPKDMFCYRIGRDIAAGRLAKYGPQGTFTPTDYKEVKKYFEDKYHPDAHKAAENFITAPEKLVGPITSVVKPDLPETCYLC